MTRDDIDACVLRLEELLDEIGVDSPFEELLGEMGWACCSDYSTANQVPIANYSHPSESILPTVKGPNARKGDVGLSRPSPDPDPDPPLLSPTSPARLPMLRAWPRRPAGPRTHKQTTRGQRGQTLLNDTPEHQQHSFVGHVPSPSFTLPWVPPGLDEQLSNTSPSSSISVSSSPPASQLTPSPVARRQRGAFAVRLLGE